MMKRIAAIGLGLGLVLGLGGAAVAAVPMMLSHQGRLFDQTGFPVEGGLDVQYALYLSASGGSPLWSESETVEANDGFFASVLGDGTALTADIFSGAPVYLGVTINGEELLPRAQLVSVPYAVVANEVTGDIHPRSVSIGDTLVIDEDGMWVGDPTGLRGPAGATGPAGAVGPAGADGAVGPAGADGAVGLAGAIGLTGPQGPTGLACWDQNQSGSCDLGTEDIDTSGECDVADCLGAPGPQGAAGPAGINGAVGSTGPQGLAGADGATGPIGPQGVAGLDGATGPIGPQGPAGLDGATGPQGPQGVAGLDGATGPQGPQGPAGLDGATGPQGPQGVAGLDGATGPQGPQGPAGLDGATGPQGPQGPQGVAGLDGATGPQGPQGPAGLDGAAGPQGPQGPTGPSGSGGGTELTDANDVVLGTVLSVGSNFSGAGFTPIHFAFVTIKTSTGHLVSIGLDGIVVFGQMYWNGGTCGSGSGILNSGSSSASRKGFCNLVMRSGDGTLYTTGATGCDANGLVDSVQIGGVTNIESSGSCSSSSSNNFGWALTATTNTAIGLPASIALPLSY